MAEPRRTVLNNVELVDRPPLCLFDFERIQVAPQRKTEYEEFHSLSLPQRQALLDKLIKRVKSL
jgi:hypothetical protein